MKLEQAASVMVIAILCVGFGAYYFSSQQTIGSLARENDLKDGQLVSASATISSQSGVISAQSSTIALQSAEVVGLGTEVTVLNGTVATLQQKTSDQQATIASLDADLSLAQGTIQMQNLKIASLDAQLNHPTLVIWNVAQTIDKGYFLYEGVPDTFDYHDSWTSSADITVYYFTDVQFSQWYTGGLSSVQGSYVSYGPTTSQSDLFTQAEGCGGFVAVYVPTTSATIYPNVSVTYNPASVSTC